MKRFRIVFLMIPLVLVMVSCGLPASPSLDQPREVTVVVVVTPTPDESNVEATSAVAAATPVEAETAPTEALDPATSTPPAAEENAALCTVVKNVNLRNGPGRVYEPPINVLQKDSTFLPRGFAPQGFPDGSWIFIEVPDSGEEGWVSADPSLVACNTDLAALPFTNPPPTPAVMRLRSSKPDGFENGITGNIFLSPRDFLRFEAIGPGGSQDGDYIKQVSFLVRDESGSTTVYEHTEENEPYCAFGGDGGCNPWPRENGQYVWGQGGAYVETGATYQVNVFVTTDDETGNLEGNWNFTVTVDLP